MAPPADETQSAPPRVLAPRQPTIGEKLYDAGDYTVKTCPAEIEIRFANEELFENFKRVLLHRYLSLQWNKFLQRDCARIQLESGKTVTIHMWEGIRSVWLSGDGKREWYNKEFHEVHADAAVGKVPPGWYLQEVQIEKKRHSLFICVVMGTRVLKTCAN